MKLGKIFWGLFFIVAAVFIVVSQLGYIQGVGIISLLLTVLLLAILIKGIASLEFTGVFFSLAFLGIIYDEQLGIEALTPWTLLGAALLLSIGVGMLWKPKHKHHWVHWSDRDWDDEHFRETIENDSGEVIKCDAKFSSAIKYVDSDHFQRADVNCSFGGIKMYFDNATVDNGIAEINVDVSFGGIEMYVPRTWVVENNVNTFLGGVEDKNYRNANGDVKVKLNGNLSFGGVTIIYV